MIPHRTRRRAAAWCVAALPALAMTGAPLHAQAPGWVGISFEVRSSSGEPERPSTVVITHVLDGSPASEAGLRPGDALLAINDVRGPEELGSLLGRLQLRAGDPVRIRVERDGWEREIRLRAAPRPADATVSSTLTLQFEPDSVVETMVRAMDALADRLAHTRGVHVASGSRDQALRRVTAAGREGPVVAAPFEFFVFRGEAYDSLRREMEQLNRRIEDLVAREQSRLRELRGMAPASDWARFAETDADLAELRAARQEASRRSLRLRAAMADAARASAGVAYSMRTDGDDGWVGPMGDEEFRPLTPYLLGRNRVAGAEVVDLRPELAEYFGVEAGVLVVDVPELTPAAVAGLRPGDVVTRLAGEPVRSVEDLRVAISRSAPSASVTLIRRGASREVLLRW